MHTHTHRTMNSNPITPSDHHKQTLRFISNKVGWVSFLLFRLGQWKPASTHTHTQRISLYIHCKHNIHQILISEPASLFIPVASLQSLHLQEVIPEVWRGVWRDFGNLSPHQNTKYREDCHCRYRLYPSTISKVQVWFLSKSTLE